MNKKNQEGITLIALIITVIVMIILAFVTTNMFIGDNGIFRKTEEGAEIYKNSANNEAESLNNLDKKMEEIMNRIDGREIAIDIILKYDANDMVSQIPKQGMQISVYKYADIESNGNIKICAGLEGLDIFSKDNLKDEDFSELKPDGTLNVDSPLYQITLEEIEESGLSAVDIIKGNPSIKPILTTTIENELEKVTFKSKQLDNSIWLVVVENGGYVGEDENYAYTTIPFMAMGVVKNGTCSSSVQRNVTTEQSDLKFNVRFFTYRGEKVSALEISNVINNYNTQIEQANFVYEIEAYKGGEKVYSNVVNVSQNAPGEQVAFMEGIPIGAQVSVKQVYISPAYTCTNGTTKTYAQTKEVESIQFINESNNKQNIKTTSSNVRIYYDEINEGWNLEITDAESSELQVETQFYDSIAKVVRVDNLSQENKMIRVKYFTKMDVTESDNLMGWEKKEDGYYYWTGTLSQGQRSEELELLRVNLPEAPSQGNQDFNIVIVIEHTDSNWNS